MMVATSRAPSGSAMLLRMRRMLEMQRQQSNQWKREAIDLMMMTMILRTKIVMMIIIIILFSNEVI